MSNDYASPEELAQAGYTLPTKNDPEDDTAPVEPQAQSSNYATPEELAQAGYHVPTAQASSDVATPEELAQAGYHVPPKNTKLQPESPGGTILRDVEGDIIPTAASVGPMALGGEAGFEAGTAIAPFLGPLGIAAPFVGAAVGAGAAGIVSSGAVGWIQQKAKEALGLDDSEQRRINAQANPIADTVGQIVPALVTFQTGKLTDRIAQRLLVGGGMAGVNVAQQKLEGDKDIDWKQVIASGAVGAIADQPRGETMRGVAEKWGNVGKDLGGKIPGVEAGRAYLNEKFPPGRPDMAYDRAADFSEKQAVLPVRPVSASGAGVSAEPAPPAKVDKIGQQALQPTVTGDGQNQLKDAIKTEAPTVTTVNQPMDDQTLAAAIRNIIPEEPPTGERLLPPNSDQPVQPMNLEKPKRQRLSLPIDRPPPPEAIRAAAIKTNEGGIFYGNNHADAAEAATNAGHTIPENDPTAIGGFLTTRGRFVGRDEAGQIADAQGQRTPQVIGESGVIGNMPTGPLKAEQTLQGRIPSQGRRLWTPPESKSSAGASQADLVKAAAEQVDKAPPTPTVESGVVDPNMAKDVALPAAETKAAAPKAIPVPAGEREFTGGDLSQVLRRSGEPAPRKVQPRLVADKAIELLKSQGKTAAARHLETMAPGPERDDLAARIANSFSNKSGDISTTPLKRPRIRDTHLKNLEVHGWTNPETGEPYRTKTLEQAKLYTRVHAINATVFDDPRFQPAPGETPDQVRTRAKAMLDKARELMDRGGNLPTEVYKMNGMPKPREWSMLRLADNYIRGKLKPDMVADVNGKPVPLNTPTEKFLTDEELHRGTDEAYKSYEDNNRREADEALRRTPTVAKIEETAAPKSTQSTADRAALQSAQERVETPEDLMLRIEELEHEGPKSALAKFEPDYKAWLDKNGGDNPAMVNRAMRAYIEDHPEVLEDKSFNAIRKLAMPEEGEPAAAVKQITQQQQAKPPGWQGGRQNLPPGAISISDAIEIMNKQAAMRKAALDEAVAKANQVVPPPKPAEGAGPGPKVAQITGVGPKAQEAVAKSVQRGWLDNVLVRAFNLSPKALSMKLTIRKAGGLRARTLAMADAALEPFRRIVNAMPTADRMQFIHAVDTGQGVDDRLTGLKDIIRSNAIYIKEVLSKLPGFEKQQWVTDHFVHLWKNPEQVARDFNNYFMKQGSGGNLLEREFPTIADGLGRGYELATDDPIESEMRYLTSMHNFIETQRILDMAVNKGDAVFIKKGSEQQPPEGWLALGGRGVKQDGQYYAPEDMAHVYNDYISAGFSKDPRSSAIHGAVQRTVNAVTALELGISFYHGAMISQEGIINDAALGMSHIAAGKFSEGFQKLLKAPSAPIRLTRVGGEAQTAYLSPNYGSPELRKLVGVLTEAGHRFIGYRHDPTYEYSKLGSFFTAWQRGSLGMELKEAKRRISEAGVGAGSTLERAGAVTKQAGAETFGLIGRTMSTVAQPIFEYYVPRMKNGAVVELLHDWIKANPDADNAAQVRQAAKFINTIDDRFGEMIQDNIFVNKMIKQTAMLGMRSYSWNLGTLRQIGGGMIAGAHGLYSDPLHPLKKLSIASGEDYDPRTAYVVAMPMVIGAMSMMYQYLKTGTVPGSVRDLAAPKTGGVGTGAASGQPERALLPGYEKDVLGYFNDPSAEARNKLSTVPRLVWETLTNKDYKDQVIADPRDPLEARLWDYLKHAGESLGPISIKQMAGKQPRGTNISLLERALAIRSAPTWIEAPDRVAQIKKAQAKRLVDQRDRSERRYKNSLQ